MEELWYNQDTKTERNKKFMKISIQRFNVHEFSVEEVDALFKASKVLEEIQNMYDEKGVLASPNDGEIVEVDELARVRGILGFLFNNRVVEVNP